MTYITISASMCCIILNIFFNFCVVVNVYRGPKRSSRRIPSDGEQTNSQAAQAPQAWRERTTSCSSV